MPDGSIREPAILDRLQSEQAMAWATIWQSCAAHVATTEIAPQCLNLHAAGDGRLLYSVRWAGSTATVEERDSAETPCRFASVGNALTFLDGVLMHYAARASEQ